jgi:hypothetical protein
MMVPRALVALALGLGAAASASAQATQSVSFQVDAINQIAFTGAPSLVVSSATAGAEPTSATAVVSWGVTTNQGNAKITASINAALPAGVTLLVSLAAPGGATSAGSVALGTTEMDLVTGLTRVAQSGLGGTYTLSATAAAGVVPSATRTVTFTITGGT